MHRVLQIPEILDFIIGYLSSKSRLSCSLVCKQWSDVALDQLWRVLDSPKPLISLLAPLSPPPHEFEFNRPIRVEDWRTFNRYAGRVRVLNLDFMHSKSPASSCYIEIAQKRPSLALLPNLTRLNVGPSLPSHLVHSLLFVTQTIKELRFEVIFGRNQRDAEPLHAAITEFLKECVVRIPKLKTFELTSFHICSNKDIEQDLVEFLSEMTSLETFNCAIYLATSGIVGALSRLPSLRVISFDYPANLGLGDIGQEICWTFHPTISPGCFPSLVDLSFAATFRDASSFMEMDMAPNLQTLYIHSPQFESAESLHKLLVLLSKKRQGITQLCLSAISQSSLSGGRSHDSDRVTIEILMPLLEFSNLVRFEVAYPRPFQVSDSDLEMLVMNWHILEVLHLCSDPFYREPPTLTPAVLPIIAKRCPKLRALSLYLEPHVEDPTASPPDPISPPYFASLQRIEFGSSPLRETDIQNFALYLSDLLPPRCKIDTLCGLSWLLESELRGSGSTTWEDGSIQHWEKVSWALRLIIKTRQRERDHSRDLEKEAKDLAMRVQILEAERRLLELSTISPTTGNLRACINQ